MALNQFGLGFIFTARDQASGTINRISRTFNQTSNRARMSAGVMQAAGVALGASAAQLAMGLAAIGGAFQLASYAAEFDQTMARAGALARATAEDMSRLEDAAINAGIATQFSPTQAAQGLTELAVRGFDATQQINALSGVLDLAAGGAIDVALAAQSVGAGLRVFGYQAEQAGYVTDRLLRIANITALQHNELALALGNVSRGAGIASQNLNEMLVAVGLVRNTGVEASVSSSAVSSALIFMARNAEEFQSRVGVSITDSEGRFRNFLDIVLETSAGLEQRYTNEAERAAVATELFGRFGLTAFQGIAQQARTGVRSATGEILRGAAAINYLRQQMEEADGAAEEFRSRMLDTFQGQRVLLQGTLQTLAVVMGQVFGRVFRPFITWTTDTINFFIRAFRAIPRPVQTAIGHVVLAISGIVAALGGVGVVAFTVALIIPIIETVAAVFGVVLAACLPAVVAVTAFAAAAVSLGTAIRSNLGGIGEFFSGFISRFRVGWTALQQLMRTGGFSRELSTALDQAENRGIRPFIVNLFAIAFRLRQVWTGFQQAFKRAFAAGGTTAVQSLMTALVELANAFGFVGRGLDSVAGTPSQRFVAAGREIAIVVARTMVVVINRVRQAVQFFTGFVNRVQEWRDVLGPTFESVGRTLREVGAAFSEAFGRGEDMAKQGIAGQSVAADWGSILADVVVPAVIAAARVFQFLAWTIALPVRAFNALDNAIQSVDREWRMFTTGFAIFWGRVIGSITSGIDAVIARFAQITSFIPAPLLNFMGLPGLAIQQARTATAPGQATQAIKGQRGGGPPTQAQPGVAAVRVSQPGAPADQSGVGGLLRDAVAATRRAAESVGRAVAQPINVVVDGETLVRVMHRAERGTAAGTFAPTPGYAED